MTVLAVLAALGVVVVNLRRGRGPVPVPGLPLLLNKGRVMSLYQGGGYGDALVREVQERVTVTRDGKLQIGVRLVDLVGGGSVEHQIVNTYVKHAEPVEVLGVVMKALDSARGIVHVDLANLRVQTNAVWRRTRLSELGDGPRDVYVSVKGKFRLAKGPDDKIVFLAAIGKDGSGANVRMECSGEDIHLDDEIPEGVFYARCLGKAQPWRGEAGELDILPVAIFQ
ncbi:hypothetical protein Q5530_36170 [Saccharothrix sp. BKS2]|uniref:hypothetical protein n=1 Tax=Saccharothrix sp. BKS2 TaxID=3064400 RepID=UPI0039ED7211